MSNYPDNVNPNDKNAPWNKVDPKDCPECKGTGNVPSDNTEDGYSDLMDCPDCDGLGYLAEEE